MSSEFLASGQNVLDSNLGGAWDITNGYAGRKQDLGIARRFGGSAAAYSLRDIGAMNGPVVRVRREPNDTTAGIDDEENFSASQVASGVLEDWVNGKLENTLPADVATAAAAYSLRKVKASYSGPVIRVRRADGAEGDVYFDSDDKLSSNSMVRFSSTESTGSFSVTGNGVQYNTTYTYNTSNGRWEAQGSESSQYYFLDSGTWTLKYAGGALASTVSGEYPWVSTWGPFLSGSVFDTSNIIFGLSDMTIGEFINGTDAFVHTWYDQTDNNDAVQLTSANQPKIAESGTLLDHINFDGNTFMDIGAFLMNATDGHCFMVISNLDTDVETFYISNRSGAKGLNFKNDTGDKGKLQVAFIGSGAITTNNVIIDDVSDNKQLIAFTKDSNDVEFFNNGAVVADDGSSRTYTTATGTANTSIGKQGNSSSASASVKQRIYELITYDTDETDNRFKIESNINNYYNLYNDGNDTSDTEWQFHNTETGTSANGTDGYVFKNSDADVGIASLELKDGVVSGDIIYYSFFYDRTTGSPTVRLASDETDSGSGVSNSDAVGTDTGFISGTLTATGTGSFFMIADNDNPSDFTISNFRMSRIARNGLVETWYDQSSNGNDATQGTATNQPAIVENGGLVTVNSKPAIKFDGTDNYFIMDSEVKFNSSDSDKANTILNVAYIVSGNRSYMGLGSGTNNWFGVPYIDNYRYRDNAGNIINTGDAVPLNQQISFTFVSDESNDIETYQNGTSIHSDNSTFTTHLRIKNIGRSYNGANYNEMSSQEIVFFADDKTSDITDLHNEINNYYGI